MARVCEACGATVESGDSFCQDCGTRIEPSDSPSVALHQATSENIVTCHQCGQQVKAAKWCSDCGASLVSTLTANLGAGSSGVLGSGGLGSGALGSGGLGTGGLGSGALGTGDLAIDEANARLIEAQREAARLRAEVAEDELRHLRESARLRAQAAESELRKLRETCEIGAKATGVSQPELERSAPVAPKPGVRGRESAKPASEPKPAKKNSSCCLFFLLFTVGVPILLYIIILICVAGGV